MKIKKQDIFQNIPVTQMTVEGTGLVHIGKIPVFVKGNVAPGDRVDIRITKVRKNACEATVIQFHSLSSHRISPKCVHFGVCGGCKWQHIDYSAQLAQKQYFVEHAFHKNIPNFDLTVKPIIAAPQPYYYRNKMEFTFCTDKWLTTDEISDKTLVTDKNALGLHVPQRFDKVLDLQECHLLDEKIAQILYTVKEYTKQSNKAFYDIKNHTGFWRNLVLRKSYTTHDFMCVLIVAENDTTIIHEAITYFQQQLPFITSWVYIVNTKLNDYYQDLEYHVFAGKPYIEENFEDIVFRISPLSFFQTNTKQAKNLYQTAVERAQIQSEHIVYDLYTGTGTIANYIAKKAKKVIGIELVDAATKDALQNAHINQSENIQFFAGDMKKILTRDFVQKHGKPDVLITDPPRAGMHADVVQTIIQVQPQTIMYISCNPETQARDIALLLPYYDLVVIQPVDMFPQTAHVECVAKLVLKK
jgi:23S rRNA (uracil1939-C5)-methyltransferase